MVYLYGYKTKQNEEREGEIRASSREGVYNQLKKQGIRPFRVVLKPGLLNRMQSVGKRWFAIVFLVLALIAVVVWWQYDAGRAAAAVTGAQLRHQIYGDPALMEELERDDFKDVFPCAGDRILASFAQPGTVPKLATTWKSRNRKEIAALLDECIAKPDAEAVTFADTDCREVRELKQIVLGIRAELRRYLSNGVGTTERYARRLMERQEREVQIYYTAKADLEKQPDAEKWERINNSLRAVGLKTIPQPANLGIEQPQKTATKEGEKTGK